MDKALKKLNVHARRELARRKNAGQVDAMVRLARPPTQEELDTLRAAGCTITAAIGPVVSISIACERLRELADLVFVRSIETARRLHPESAARLHEAQRRT